MRTLALALAVIATSTVLPAQQADRPAPGGRLPPGWQVRLDRPTSRITDISFTTSEAGFRAVSGPAAIFYHPRYQATGQYEIGASFTQASAPEHPEAYGLFFGGQELIGPDQRYYYFLARGDGSYMIRQRTGSELSMVQDWTASPALNRADASGRATNVLRVVVAADVVRFLANDQEVHSVPVADMPNTNGQAGIRVNHNLDVEIAGFLLEPARR